MQNLAASQGETARDLMRVLCADRVDSDDRSVDVTYASTWDPCLPRIFEAIEAHRVCCERT